MIPFLRGTAMVFALLLLGGCFGGRLAFTPSDTVRPSLVTPPANTPDFHRWRVHLNRGGKDSTFTVLIEQNAGNGFQVAALNDMGGTVFQATTAGNGVQAAIQRNNLRIPDHVLARTFVQDALLAFLALPPDGAEPHVLNNGRPALITHHSRGRACAYIFREKDGALDEFMRLRHHSITYHARFTTPGQPFQGGYKITCYRPRYTAVYRPMRP